MSCAVASAPKKEQTRTRPCDCTKGLVVEANIKGEWVSIYNVWDLGAKFGNLTRVPCCRLCSIGTP